MTVLLLKEESSALEWMIRLFVGYTRIKHLGHSGNQFGLKKISQIETEYNLIHIHTLRRWPLNSLSLEPSFQAFPLLFLSMASFIFIKIKTPQMFHQMKKTLANILHLLYQHLQ